MSVLNKNPFVLVTSIGSLCALSLLGGHAFGQSSGVFSNSGALGTSDQTATVGISTTKTYVQAIDLGDTVNTVVNGVTFTGSGAAVAPSGTGWALTGTLQAYGGGGTLPGGALGGLTNKFVYAGLPATMTLTGLTAGQTYVVTFYNRSWDAAGLRQQNITASGASSATTLFDENIGASGQGNLNLLRYTFQASSATQALSFAPLNTANSMHFYAFTNEQTFNNTWTSGADWSTAAWSKAMPDSVGSNASFGAQGTPTGINLDFARTVGHLQFDGTNAWTLSGANTLTLQTDVGGVSVLSALAGSHTISTPIVLGSDAAKLGSGTLTLSGQVSGSKGLNVSGGQLNLNVVNTYTGGTIVNDGGKLKLGAAGALGGANNALTVNTGGTLDLNGISQNVGNLSGTGGTIANDANSTNVVLTVGTGDTGGGTFSGVLADHTTGTGTLALTKTGTGTITLAGANTYTGVTNVSNGRLQLNGNAATGTLSTSGINVAATGTFGFTTGAGSNLTLKSGSSFSIGGGTLALDIGTPTTSDKLVADNFTLTANSALALNLVAPPTAGATYTLATFNSLTNSGSFTLSGSTAGRMTLTPVLGANAITMTAALDSSTWANTTGGAWGTGPWSSYTPNAAGDSAVFGPSLLSTGTVTFDGAKTVGYLTFNNSTAAYTLGTAGGNNLTLNNGTSAAIVYVNGGTHTIAENVALASNVSISVDASTALAIKGNITGARSLSKYGAGTLTLAGTNTYSTGTTIAEGTLRLGDGTTNGVVAGNITNNAALIFNNGTAQTFAGIISGTGTTNKTSNGVLTLTGASNGTGTLTISGGTVDIGGNSVNGSFAGSIVNNATLRFSRTNASTIPNVVTGTGNTVVVGGVSAATGATLAPTASINTPTLSVGDGTTQGWLNFSAPNQLNGTTGVVLNIGAHANNSRINLQGFNQTIAGLTGTGIVQSGESGTFPANTLTINVAGSNAYSWTGLIRNQATSALGVTKTGTGDQTMNFSITNPSYTGATTVSQGRLTFGSTMAAPAWGTSGISVASGAEVALTGAGAGVVSWSEGVVISGAGGLARTGADANTVTITNGTNSFTGTTRLSGSGTLSVASLANIGSNSAIGAGTATNAATNAASLILDGGKLRYTGAAVNSNRLFTLTQNGGTIDASGAAALNLNNSGALATSGSGARTLVLTGTNTGNNTLAGILPDGTGGATSLTKTQTGTWVLSGASTYTGATTIDAGRLQLEGSAASTTRTTSNLQVNAGATFGFTAGTGSTVAFGGAFTLGGGTLALDLGQAAASDKITANSFALTANSTLSFNLIGGLNIGSSYTLASYSTLSNPGSFTLSGPTAGRLSLNPVIGATAITMTPVLDSAIWNNPAGGSWDTGPWTGYTPNAVGDAAFFGSVLSGNGGVSIDTAKTVGYLTFDHTASYTIGSFGSANLTLANAGTAPALISVNAGSHTLMEDTFLTSDVVMVNAASTNFTIEGSLNGLNKSLTKSGLGTLTLQGSSNFGTGPGAGFNINQGKVILNSPSALNPGTNVTINDGELDMYGNDTVLGSLAGSAGRVTDNGDIGGLTTLTVSQTSATTFGGVIADGVNRTVALVKSGSGSLTLAGANTFTGGFTLLGGSVTAASGLGTAINGPITLGNGGGGAIWLISGAASQQYGPGTVLTFANVGADAKFELRGTNQTLAGLDSALTNNLSIIQNDELTAPGYTSAPGNAILTLDTATDHSFYGIIRNQIGGALGIVKTGPGTQEFINHPTIGSFDYTGDTTINNGKLVLKLGGALSAGYASNVIVNAAGTLGLDGNWTLNRTVTGSGQVIKQGAGTVTVSSALSHTGNTTIAEGTLVLTGSILGSAKIDVLSGATFNVSGVVGGFTLGSAQTLTGNGTILGAATINGTLAPGDGLGTLTTGNLSLDSNSVFALEINTSSVTGLTGTSDLAAVGGAFALSSGIAPSLTLADLGSNVLLAAGTQFTFVTYSGGWNGGVFSVGGNAIPDEGVFTFGANQFRLDYDAGGNSVALIAVPEPTVALSFLGGLALLVGVRRRRA